MPDPLRAVDDWPVVGSVLVVGPDGVLAGTGPVHEPRPWASVTKLLAALATLVAVEEGSVALDDPAGPPGSTLRHLLAHASGLGMEAGDDPVGRPGERRAYSNLGIELAAAAVAEGSGVDVGDYLREGVIGPLGLAGTTVGASAAHGGRGPATDLARLAGELLRPRLVAPGTLAEARTVAFPGLDGILPGFGRQAPNDWGLGFELRDHKQPHWTGPANSPATFGHFGQSGSFVWVDPERDLALVGLADRGFGPWARTAWPALADAVLNRWG